MFKESKIDNFFEKKKKFSTFGLSTKEGKSGSRVLINETLTKAKMEKELLNFDLDSRYGPSYGIILMNFRNLVKFICFH